MELEIAVSKKKQAIMIGKVRVRRFGSIWCNGVIRSDVDNVGVGTVTSIGENTVLLRCFLVLEPQCLLE